MTLQRTLPTPYPDVNKVLDELLAGVQTILGDRLIGMYLYGSLSSGDFDPEASDIDFLVVTRDEVPGELVPALEALFTRLLASGDHCAEKLEGTFISQQALRRYDPNDPPRPCINERHFFLAQHASDWVIQRHILREQGVAVLGPPLKNLIDPVQPDEIKQAVIGQLREWWSPMLDTPGRLHENGYQSYAILTMCRALYALEYGAIVSKPVAARWAQETFGERWPGLIEKAMAGRHGAPMDRLNETLDLIRYTLERSSLRESRE